MKRIAIGPCSFLTIITPPVWDIDVATSWHSLDRRAVVDACAVLERKAIR